MRPRTSPAATAPRPKAAKQRIGRPNLALDSWGRPLPHYPHHRSQALCERRRIQ